MNKNNDNYIQSPVKRFIEDYKQANKVRLHMPGHKGAFGYDGDITEITGADSLYEADGIIAESEKQTSDLFGTYRTFYGTEGSSQLIKAMCFLAVQRSSSDRPVILAARNAHKSFIYASMLLGFDIKWISPKRDSYSLCKCDLSASELEEVLKNEMKPGTDTNLVAVYITSPDYLGNILDIKGLASVAHQFGLPLMVDNAHGAYLKFLEGSDLHPVSLGADIVCDSAHKTLPVLTGGAYLHISKDSLFIDSENIVRKALLMFGSTSPSYQILESLDMVPERLGKLHFGETVIRIAKLKKNLAEMGYRVCGISDDMLYEPLKITIELSCTGIDGVSILALLSKSGIECEYADPDYLVTMWSPYNEYPGDYDRFLDKMREITSGLSPNAEKEESNIIEDYTLPEVKYQPYEIMYKPHFTEQLDDSLIGRVAADTMISCPPAIAPIVAGEVIDENVLKVLKHYNIKTLEVLKV